MTQERRAGRSSRWTALGAAALLLVGATGWDWGSWAGWSGGVRIVSFSPQGTVRGRRQVFRIRFAQEVGPERVKGEPFSAATLVRITPPLPGTFVWENRRTLAFTPTEALSRNARYSFEVLPELVGGRQLSGKTTFEVGTAPFLLSETRAFRRAGKKGAPSSYLIGVRFSYPVDSAELKKHVTLTDAKGRPLAWTPGRSAKSEVHQLATGPWSEAQAVEPFTLAVAATLPCEECAAPMGRRRIVTVAPRVRAGLRIEEIAPVTGGERPRIRVRLSAPVDAEQVASFIGVEPEVDLGVTGRFTDLELSGFAHGKTYKVTLRKGLRAADGAVLSRDDTRTVALQDIKPSLRFRDEGLYLPRGGDMSVMITSVNVAAARVVVDKVFSNNLVSLMHTLGDRGFGAAASRYYYYANNYQLLGTRVLEQNLTLGDERNTESRTSFSLSALEEDRRKGLFRVTVEGARLTAPEAGAEDGGEGDGEGEAEDYSYDRRLSDSKWVLVTDIGLIGRMSRDRFVVFASSLSTLKSLAGVKLTLVSQNNQTLAEADTDGAGRAEFRGLSAYAAEGLAPFLVRARLGADESFLLFKASELSLADLEVDGRDEPQGLQAFLWTDRGVYRPDDTVRLAGVIRTETMAAPPSLPVTLSVRDPQGNDFRELVLQRQSDGGFDLALPIPFQARTGRYTVSLRAGSGPTIGEGAFSVEDFVPDRLRVAVTTQKASFAPGESVQVKVKSEYLFGAPAAGKPVTVHARLTDAAFRPKGYSDWIFGPADTEFKPVELAVGDGELSPDGSGEFSLSIPDEHRPRGYLVAAFSAHVRDEGGRGVTGSTEASLYPYKSYAGLRPNMSPKDAEERRVRCQVVLLSPDGKPTAGKVTVSLHRRNWNSIWRRDESGRFRYVSEYEDVPVAERTVSIATGPQEVELDAEDWGSYRLRVTGPGGALATETEFWLWGWGWSSAKLSSPDRLDLSLEKAEYAGGETARVRIQAPFSGRLLLTVERDEVLWHRWVDLKENTAVIPLPVAAAWKPNVYVTATLLRSTREMESRDPARAYGVTRLVVRQPADRIAVTLSAPETVRPGTTLKVGYDLGGAGKARVTIAAIDEGILQLTNFRTPDPYGFFYGIRRLGTRLLDLYSYVLPELRDESGLTGGDEARRARHLGRPSVKRIKPVALWSGMVEAGSDGKGSVEFPLPQYEGEVTLTAVAFRGQAFGAAKKSVRVRAPLTIEPTLPRFLGTGDRFIVPVQVFNGTGKRGVFTVTVEAAPSASIEEGGRKSIDLPAGGAGVVRFNGRVWKAAEPAKVIVTGAGNGETSRQVFDLPVRSPRQIENIGGSGAASSGRPGAFTFPKNFIKGTDRYALAVSGLPEARFGSGLSYLLHYPYGCVEQTTSGAFPLLYFDEVARAAAPDRFAGNKSSWYVQEGIRRIESMMAPRGDFSYWPGGGGVNAWCSTYASHFLVEAKAKGFEVSDRVLDGIKSAMRRRAKGDQPDHYEWYDGGGDATRVYACLVLALLGEPDQGSMNYLREQKATLLSPAMRGQLAQAYALSGDRARARELLPSAAPPLGTGRETGGTLSTPVREAAILLEACHTVDPRHPAVPGLLKQLVDAAPRGRWDSTQETAFALKALGKVYAAAKHGSLRGAIVVNGVTTKALEEKGVTQLAGRDLGGAKVEIRAEGETTAYFYWEADGVIDDPTPPQAYDRELEVRRVFKDRAGAPISVAAVKQGDLIVAEVTLAGARRELANLAIVDLLPSGFEIENPRLASTEGLDWIGDARSRVDYLDLRDDRVMLFTALQPGATNRYHYSLRAVTAGTFALPPIKAEAMYDPAVTSLSGAGEVTIVP